MKESDERMVDASKKAQLAHKVGLNGAFSMRDRRSYGVENLERFQELALAVDNFHLKFRKSIVGKEKISQ